ncbi:hypothetical protein C8F04DRAFT_1284262 [Mycena alexandri]|uniref:F-box domain-containing protein n=1 Tax=Mycena alexandri TaxID=1745969 RepID=A0AAD6RVR0_9AGAR|nr:hypothetical protein C8F04DRAFT_1284262 [Mycena alexandri]
MAAWIAHGVAILLRNAEPRLSMVCRGWYHVVEDIGAFWSDYSITEDLDPDDLEQWAARAGRTPLHLHAVFEIVRLLPPPGGRLASLSVCAEDLISLPVVLDAMRATSFPLLLKLAIARIHVESTADVDPTLPMTNVFNAVFPQLTFLRLVNAIFCWADMCKFTHLTTLILHNITGNLAPTMGNIAMVLRSVPFLARLSARKLDCVRSTVEHGIVELTKLVSMDVQLDGCEAFADLLAGCSFPALRTLSVMLSNPIDSGLILKTELFETVHHFIGAGIAPGTKEAVKMYERMSDLRSLDVSSGSRRFLTPFMSKRGPSKSVLCPLLNDVTLCEIDMNDLKTCWLGLPLELFRLVLSLAFGFYFDDRDGYIRIRTSAMGVCRSWRDLIVYSGDYWSSYSPNTDKLFRDVNVWSSRFGSSLTDFRITFDPDRIVRRGRTTVEDVAAFVAHHVERNRSLYLDVEDDYSLPLLASSLLLAKAPHLRELGIRRSARFLTTRIRRPFPPIFCSFTAIPELRVLKLADFSFDWSQPLPFARLTVLVVSKLTFDLAPTPEEFRSALISAPLLMFVSVRGVASRGGGTYNLAPFVMQFVTELDLCFCGEDGVASVISACTFPSLVVLSIDFHGPSDLDHLLKSRDSLSRVQQFHGSGLIYSSLRVPELFNSLKLVVAVYIFDGGRSLFDGLCSAHLDALNVACPSMSSLALSNVNYRELHAFVMSRVARGFTLDTLKVHYTDVVPRSGYFFDGIKDNVARFMLNPAFDWPATWVA